MCRRPVTSDGGRSHSPADRRPTRPPQLAEGSFGLFNAKANGGGVAFFAHVGGFIFGALVTRLLIRAGQATPQARYADSPVP
jgi:hypothetical protein